MGIMYERNGENQKALEYFFKAYHINHLKLGAADKNTKIYFENMVLMYRTINPKGDYKKWLSEQMKSLHMRKKSEK